MNEYPSPATRHAPAMQKAAELRELQRLLEKYRDGN